MISFFDSWNFIWRIFVTRQNSPMSKLLRWSKCQFQPSRIAIENRLALWQTMWVILTYLQIWTYTVCYIIYATSYVANNIRRAKDKTKIMRNILLAIKHIVNRLFPLLSLTKRVYLDRMWYVQITEITCKTLHLHEQLVG